MKIFALSDLHLSFNTNKPMHIFGDNWTNYEEEVKKNWNQIVTDDDVCIIAGDISWAMKMEEARQDFDFINTLNGKKIIIRGNHDYWWKSVSKIREFVGEGISVLQNDSVTFGDTIFVGTRGWQTPERNKVQTDENKKIYDREVLRFEMSLKSVVDRAGKKLVAILHYPPFNCLRDDSPFTKLCEQYDVDAVVYGHLHGKQGRGDLLVKKNGIKYYLTSTDLINHKPIEINL